LNLKASNIEQAMMVLPHKLKMIDSLNELFSNQKEVSILRENLRTAMDNHIQLKKQSEKTTSAISRVQMKMMFLLQHLEDREKQKQNKDRVVLREIDIPSTPKLFDRAGATQAFSETNTPRMMIADYAKSPFAKKRTKVQLQFTDFEAEISQEDFNKIPGYMRGRTTQSELQDFLDNVVIRAFNEKYQILFKQRATLKPSEFCLQNMFKDQASYFEGMKFITVGDIARILGKNVDKRDERFIQMQRHLQIIREARKNSTICYIWIKRS